ncbi:Protein kinase-like domain protein [Cordyceps fumosorosea ARSEF 2679]|uniref:Protein kinase-like domain protein n=1 Tax=Cordyceps fumosorosea (strain ARSEF 2679) TaxID=1081104 RepID=A0A167TNP5_CORFA|nr:Protein kinase-like domain protein [Cordyceps fumosorosea ARSEF 2679]OAA60787.1 Protein kinase-like domain protein [Cordyceps fumosorosea ARSEF 2679]
MKDEATTAERRHTVIRKIVTQTLGIQHNFTIEQNTVATNNHVYIIRFSEPIETAKKYKNDTPLTVEIPAGTSHLVMRYVRLDNNVEDSIRIRNEVAFLTLARKALANVDPSLVPQVFDWDDDLREGYIIQEFKPGEHLSYDDLHALGEKDAKFVCKQLAAVAKAFQDYEMPVEGYGGLTFDNDGDMSATEIIFRTGGPFSTYRDYLKAALKWQLAQSESVVGLNGWRNTPGLRERIDAFVANGLDRALGNVPKQKPTLVHGDLTVLDFDFGHIGSAVTEFLYSFQDFQGLIDGIAEPGDGLRDLLLNGFAGPVEAKFAIGKAWDEALAVQGALRPCTIEGADDVSNLWWFAQELLQFHWLLPRFYQSQSEEQLERWVAKSRGHIEAYLEHWGF